MKNCIVIIKQLLGCGYKRNSKARLSFRINRSDTQMTSEIQAVIFNNKAWNEKRARKELKKLNLMPLKPAHRTSNYLRYRIKDPSQFARFVTKPTSKDYSLVIGFYQ